MMHGKHGKEERNGWARKTTRSKTQTICQDSITAPLQLTGHGQMEATTSTQPAD